MLNAIIPKTKATHCFFDNFSLKNITAAISVAKINPPFAMGKNTIFGNTPDK